MVERTSVPEAARIGVFGGTFDPIHCAHLAMARAAMEYARLDKVLFVVSARPPHKSQGAVATAEQRYAMVRLALEDEPRMEPCRFELERPGLSYTVDTVQLLSGQYPRATLYLILGMDSLVDFSKWREPRKILELARILAIPREGCTPPEDILGFSYDVVPFEKTPMSSTDVRRKLAAGDSVEAIIPPRVLTYIRQEGLYGVAR